MLAGAPVLHALRLRARPPGALARGCRLGIFPRRSRPVSSPSNPADERAGIQAFLPVPPRSRGASDHGPSPRRSPRAGRSRTVPAERRDPRPERERVEVRLPRPRRPPLPLEKPATPPLCPSVNDDADRLHCARALRRSSASRRASAPDAEVTRTSTDTERDGGDPDPFSPLSPRSRVSPHPSDAPPIEP